MAVPHVVVHSRPRLFLIPDLFGLAAPRAEIEALEWDEGRFEEVEERMYRPLVDTPCTWVDTPEELALMIDMLKRETAVAIDLEHHSVRSFQGFLCLMQVRLR